MEIFRKISATIVALLLSLSLFLGLTAFSITNYLGSRENIKQTLNESGVYDNLVDNILASIEKEQTNNKTEDLPLDNPEVQAALKKALPPAFFKNSIEQVLDGTYNWLEGESETINFKISLKQAKIDFISSVADYVVKRAEKLPVCTSPEQIGDPNDLFNVKCRPPDFDAAAAKQKFIAEAQSSEFLGDSDVFDASKLSGKDNNSKQKQEPIEEKLAKVKQGYSFSKQLPIILGIVALVLSLLLFVLHPNHAKAMNALKNIYFSAGISILIFSGIAWFVFKKISTPNLKIAEGVDNPELQRNAIAAITTIFDKIIIVMFIGALVYIAIGMVCWLVSRKLSGPLSEEQKENNINKVLHTKELNDKDAVSLDSNTTKPAENTEKAEKQDENTT